MLDSDAALFTGPSNAERSSIRETRSVEFVTPAGSQIGVLGLSATPAGTLTMVPVLVK